MTATDHRRCSTASTPGSPTTGSCSSTSPSTAPRSRRSRRRCRTPTCAEDDLFLLIFTSGSTGLPKAVRCTQGRFARTGAHVAGCRRARRPATSSTRRCRSSTPARCSPGGRRRLTAGIPIATAAEVLGVGHAARHPPLRRDDAHLHRQGPQLHPGHARAARRRRQPAAAGHRQRGVGPRHHGVRPPVRLHGARQLRLDRGHHHHPPGPVDAGGRARARPTRPSRCSTPRPGRSARRSAFGADGRPTNLDEAVGEIVETAPTSGFEGYYKNEEATSARFRDGLVLVGRPGLPRRRRLAVLRRAVERVAARRRRELRRRAGRGDRRPPPRRALGRRVRRARRPGRRPRDGRARAAGRPRSSTRPAFDAFLAEQPDLGPKWLPAFVRVDRGAARSWPA